MPVRVSRPRAGHLGDPEVEDLHDVVLGDVHVVGLEIAWMTPTACRGERRSGLLKDAHRLAGGQGPPLRMSLLSGMFRRAAPSRSTEPGWGLTEVGDLDDVGMSMAALAFAS
jgi:hypothetical protein